MRIYFKKLLIGIIILLCLLIISGCISGINSSKNNSTVTRNNEGESEGLVDDVSINHSTEIAQQTLQPQSININYSQKIPKRLKEFAEDFNKDNPINSGDVIDLFLDIDNNNTYKCIYKELDWYYLLVAPYPTVQDEISLDELQNIWLESIDDSSERPSIYLSEDTYYAIASIFGEGSNNLLNIVNDDTESFREIVFNSKDAFAIIPFEDLDPYWKVIKIDGSSLINNGDEISSYPLIVHFEIGSKADDCLQAEDEREVLVFANFENNFIPEKLTSIMMTGTTALVRNTAQKMEQNGVLYPARDILKVLADADITHISNEVPFSEECPPADPVRTDWDFCSDPTYIDLLKYIDADVIELTGNHVMDWGPEAFEYTLDLYDQNEFRYYGGGRDMNSAKKPLLFEHNGNKIAFIGCNASGPSGVWADFNSPGAAQCEKEWIEKSLLELKNEGYIIIFTFQHIENCDYSPHLAQQGDFLFAADAGADIVSGSQSHCPQAILIKDDKFIHYGLGNLFFDQMDYYASREMIDKHYVYDGTYISTELFTIVLEDYAKPRLMNEAERKKLLNSIFRTSEWVW